MKIELKQIFMLNSVAVLIGLGFMIIPDLLMDMLSLSDAADGPLAMRFFGILLFGIGILTFSIRNEEASSIRKSVILSLFLIYLIQNVFIFIYYDLTNLMVWSIIFLHTILIVAYGYFYLND